MTASEHFSDQRSRIATELRRVAGKADHPYALLDFPNHGNPGDAAIWVGERRILGEIYGCRPVYTGGTEGFSLENLCRRLGPEGTVFLHGGGNFGDLWDRHELFRERIIRSMPEHRIVMLPQTINFESRSALGRARTIINRHDSLSILLRDEASLEIARREFACPVRLCPDGALGIGGIKRRNAPSVDLLILLRQDREQKWDTISRPDCLTSITTDWLEPLGTTVERFDTHVRRLRALGQRADLALYWASGFVGDAAARARLRRACDVLSRGRVVITDRIHGHILSTLLRIPNVVMDNSYGKNRRYYETWSRDDPVSRFCDDPAEAVDVALELAAIAETRDSSRRD